MLEDCFSGFFKKYHVDASKDGTLTIRDDCPQDLFEKLKTRDAEYFQKRNEHLYTNFETEQQSN